MQFLEKVRGLFKYAKVIAAIAAVISVSIAAATSEWDKQFPEGEEKQ